MTRGSGAASCRASPTRTRRIPPTWGPARRTRGGADERGGRAGGCRSGPERNPGPDRRVPPERHALRLPAVGRAAGSAGIGRHVLGRSRRVIVLRMDGDHVQGLPLSRIGHKRTRGRPRELSRRGQRRPCAAGIRGGGRRDAIGLSVGPGRARQRVRPDAAGARRHRLGHRPRRLRGGIGVRPAGCDSPGP